MGGIYLLGRQDGTVVSGNVVHDIYASFYGGEGLYADEGSSNMLFEYNVCYNVSADCFYLHYGSSNVVRNNVFAYAGDYLIRGPHNEGQVGIMTYNNVLIPDDRPAYNCSPLYLASDNNLILTNGKGLDMAMVGEDKFALECVRSDFGWDVHSIVKEYAGEDYIELTQTQTAKKLGIKPIEKISN